MPGPLSTPDRTKAHLETAEQRKHGSKGFSGKTAATKRRKPKKEE